jgi:hypothetical protein
VTLAQTSTGKGTNAFNIAFLTQQAGCLENRNQGTAHSLSLLDCKYRSVSITTGETGVGLNLGSSAIDLVLYNLNLVDE